MEDQVDRTLNNLSEGGIQDNANSNSEHERLRRSSSGSLIMITDCGPDSSAISTADSYGKHGHGVPPVPIGLKIVALVSMTTAIVLISASGILLSKSHETLVKWLRAAPETMSLLTQVNNLLGGTTGIVEEVQSQEKYLRILITCSAILVVTGMVQLLCNIWFFCRMNAPCIRRCLSKTEQFFCGI